MKKESNSAKNEIKKEISEYEPNEVADVHVVVKEEPNLKTLEKIESKDFVDTKPKDSPVGGAESEVEEHNIVPEDSPAFIGPRLPALMTKAERDTFFEDLMSKFNSRLGDLTNVILTSNSNLTNRLKENEKSLLYFGSHAISVINKWLKYIPLKSGANYKKNNYQFPEIDILNN